MIKAGPLAQLQKDFKTCQHLTNKTDLKTFASTLETKFIGPVQYNRMSGNTSSIGEMCKIMMVADPYKALQEMFAVSRIENFLAILPPWPNID